VRKGGYLILGVYILGLWGAAFGQTFETFRGIQWGADKKEVSGLLAGPQRENVEVYTEMKTKRLGILRSKVFIIFFTRGNSEPQ